MLMLSHNNIVKIKIQSRIKYCKQTMFPCVFFGISYKIAEISQSFISSEKSENMNDNIQNQLEQRSYERKHRFFKKIKRAASASNSNFYSVCQ